MYLKENVSKKAKFLVNDLLTIYNTLSKEEKKLVSEIALKYRPKQKTFKWANRIFKKPTSLPAKICMYEVDQYLQKQEKPKKDNPQRDQAIPDKVSKDLKKYKEKKKKTVDVSKPDTRVISQRIQKNESVSTYKLMMI